MKTECVRIIQFSKSFFADDPNISFATTPQIVLKYTQHESTRPKTPT